MCVTSARWWLARARIVAWLGLLLASPAAAQEPTRELAGATTCQAAEPVELGASSVRTLHPALALAPDGRGLAVWPASERLLHVRALASEGLGPVREVELEHASGLRTLAAAGGAFVALATHPRCDRRGHPCLRALALGPDGSALAAPHEPPPGVRWSEPTAELRLPDALATAWAGHDSVSIEIFRVTEGVAIARQSHALASECVGGAVIDALATDRGALIALGRSACEASPRFLLSLDGRRDAIPALPALAEVRRFTVRSGVATVVYRVEGLRPRLLRLAIDGARVVEGPIALRPDALPLDVEDVVLAEVVTERDRLVLRRADLAGAPIGEALDLGPAVEHPITRLAWDGRRFVVLVATRAERAWTIELRAVTCATT